MSNWAGRINLLLLILILAMTTSGVLLLAREANGGPLDPPSPPASSLPQIEPRIPITTLPVTITQPGSYFVTKNLQGVPDQHGITITVSSVRIDLNGFELVGDPSTRTGIVSDSNTSDITIVDGIVRNWGWGGLNLINSERVTLEGVSSSNNMFTGIGVGSHSSLLNVSSNSNGIHGIEGADGMLIRECSVYFNGGDGINIGAGTIRDCTVQSNGNDGIEVFSSSIVEGNRVGANGIEPFFDGAGILVTGTSSRIEANSVINNGVGIRVTTVTNTIVRNIIRGSPPQLDITGGNVVGPLQGPGTLTDPWANIQN